MGVLPAAVMSEVDGLIVDPSQIGVIGIKVMLLVVAQSLRRHSFWRASAAAPLGL